MIGLHFNSDFCRGLRFPVDCAEEIVIAVALILPEQRVVLEDRVGGAERRALHRAMRVGQPRAESGKRHQREVGVSHATHGVEHDRRFVDLRPGQRGNGNTADHVVDRISARNVGVRQQVVIRIEPVAAEQSGELVDCRLGEVELGHDVGIAAEAGAECREVVDKCVLVIRKGMQRECLGLNARSAVEVDEGVIHFSAARDTGHAAAHIDGVMGGIAGGDGHG